MRPCTEETGREGDYSEEYTLSSAACVLRASRNEWILLSPVPTASCSAQPQGCRNGKGSHGVEYQKPPSLLQAASHSLARAFVTLKETEAHTNLVGLVGLV